MNKRSPPPKCQVVVIQEQHPLQHLDTYNSVAIYLPYSNIQEHVLYYMGTKICCCCAICPYNQVKFFILKTMHFEFNFE